MNENEKILQVKNALDRVECTCEERWSVICRVCDVDLINIYGSSEIIPDLIDLNKWPSEGLRKLIYRRKRIKN